MRILIPMIATSLLLSGCASSFLNNGPRDATAVSKSTSIIKVNSKESRFFLYKLNSKHFALLPVMGATPMIIDRINQAIIFDEEQASKLRSTCEAIIKAYEIDSKEDARVIEYHLVDNQTELSRADSTVITADRITSTARIEEFRRVVFRLQYLAKPGVSLSTRKEIRYMFFTQTSTMSIGDVKMLLTDLQK